MSSSLDVGGKVALITGAASGIGRAVALSLAKRGCNLALADVNEAGLVETARLVGNSVHATRHRLDVSDAGAIAAFPNEIIAAHGGLDILVNNAGVALGGSFAEVSEQEFDWLLEINLMGVVRMTRAFLSELKKRPQAQLVNVSSVFGIIAPPKNAAYALSKFGVRAFSESLRHELLEERSGVGVSVVYPGGVRTAIADNARIGSNVSAELEEKERQKFAAALRMAPERAGEIIVMGIEKRKRRILVGSDAKLVAIIERLAPLSYWSLLGRLMK